LIGCPFRLALASSPGGACKLMAGPMKEFGVWWPIPGDPRETNGRYAHSDVGGGDWYALGGALMSKAEVAKDGIVTRGGFNPNCCVVTIRRKFPDVAGQHILVGAKNGLPESAGGPILRRVVIIRHGPMARARKSRADATFAVKLCGASAIAVFRFERAAARAMMMSTRA